MEYSKDPDIRAIEIIDPDNMIVASQNPKQIGRVLQDQQWLDMKSQQREVLQYTGWAYGESLLIIVAPLIGNGEIEAWIRVKFSLANLHNEENQLILSMTLLTVLLMAAGILGVQWSQKQMSSFLQNVINQLQEMINERRGSSELNLSEPSRVSSKPKKNKKILGTLEQLRETVTETVGLLKIQSEALRDSTLVYWKQKGSRSDHRSDEIQTFVRKRNCRKTDCAGKIGTGKSSKSTHPQFGGRGNLWLRFRGQRHLRQPGWS